MANWIRSAVCIVSITICCWGILPLDVSAQTLPQFPPITMAILSFPGNRPDNLGVKNGRLAACPDSPNCVSSQAPGADKEHGIAPIAYTGEAKDAIAQLKTILAGLERTTIVESSDTYLYAEFATKLMGFVDDVEFYADDSAKVIHVRSASRLGQSDLGVNRKRVEEIRSSFTKIASTIGSPLPIAPS
jgi:uncharacterized protein (DUF1499 family)